ncbi:MAG: GNAT family N-acetyltransferase [Candidatus Omnitrophota bacterium]|jgi:ribosomal protein S18 acetylase RimI-like enzyme|nr:MAG: GNAT family N-acetyltransferase [Candidatus Omnitrophota bacterium]
MTDLKVRRAKLEDLPHVTALWKEMMDYHLSLDEHFEMVSNSDKAYLDYLVSVIDNYDYAILIAEKNGAIVGYTIGMILVNPAVFSLARYGFIAEMAITASEQHAGIGEQLWLHVRKWFFRRGIEVIQLNVSPRNKKGYNFWQKMGCSEFLHIMWHDIPKDM